MGVDSDARSRTSSRPRYHPHNETGCPFTVENGRDRGEGLEGAVTTVRVGRAAMCDTSWDRGGYGHPPEGIVKDVIWALPLQSRSGLR